MTQDAALVYSVDFTYAQCLSETTTVAFLKMSGELPSTIISLDYDYITTTDSDDDEGIYGMYDRIFDDLTPDKVQKKVTTESKIRQELLDAFSSCEFSLAAKTKQYNIKVSQNLDDFRTKGSDTSTRYLVHKAGSLQGVLDADGSDLSFAGNLSDVDAALLVAGLEQVCEKYSALLGAEKCKIFLISTGSQGNLRITPYSLKPGKNDADVPLNLLYGEEFMAVDTLVKEHMAKKASSGLALFHGPPGTGKTSYIRHLITSTERKVIFVPRSLITSITTPQLTTLMINNRGSVFIMEDAEEMLQARNDQGGSSAVSDILNISDGLLSDLYDSVIICTFNCDLQQLDPALTRRGRLIASHYFDRLNKEASTKLMEHLGKDVSTVKDNMSLAEIFNEEDTTVINKEKVVEKPRMGFVR